MRQNGNWINDQHLRQGSPVNTTYAENISPYQVVSNLSALTTQVMLTVALPLQAGDKVTNLTFVSATTAANTPTNYWFALYDTSGALLAQTADQLTAAWAANTVKTLALSSAQYISTAGIYYAGIMVKATAVPTLAGVALHNAVLAGAIAGSKILAQTSGSALDTTAPATIATPTTVANVPYCVAT